MVLDPQEGLYLFEVVIGFKIDREKEYSPPFLVQADDAEEAEEKVLEFLDDADLDQTFWIEELSDPFDIEEYIRHADDNDIKTYPLLLELTEEELKDLLNC